MQAVLDRTKEDNSFDLKIVPPVFFKCST